MPKPFLPAAVLSLALTGALSGAAPAQTAPEVIAAQIEAMRAGDFALAFTHASDGIRSLFGTPGNFERMVRQGYPMVVDPAEVRFLDRESRQGGGEIQRVLFLTRDGRSYLLEYLLSGEGAARRIAAVRILPETGAGV